MGTRPAKLAIRADRDAEGMMRAERSERVERAAMGVGYDGRGEASPANRRMSIVQRKCQTDLRIYIL